MLYANYNDCYETLLNKVLVMFHDVATYRLLN